MVSRKEYVHEELESNHLKFVIGVDIFGQYTIDTQYTW